MLEEPEWHSFFWSSLPASGENESVPLAQSLINAICVSGIELFVILLTILIFSLLIYCKGLNQYFLIIYFDKDGQNMYIS